MATLIDPPMQESGLANPLIMCGPRQGAGERMHFQQAWEKIYPKLVTPITLADMENMPATKRGCLEEKIVGVAMQDGFAQIKWQVMLQEGSAVGV